MIRPGTCNRCGKEITWIRRESDKKWLPCEFSPVDAVNGGNERFITMTGEFFNGRRRTIGENAIAVQVYVPHWFYCKGGSNET